MLLLPLAHTGHARIRALGVLAPLVPPYWLGAKPVVALDTAAPCAISATTANSRARFVSAARRQAPPRLRRL